MNLQTKSWGNGTDHVFALGKKLSISQIHSPLLQPKYTAEMVLVDIWEGCRVYLVKQFWHLAQELQN